MMTWQESVAWRPEIEGYSEDILPFFTAIEHLIPKGGTYLEVGVYKGRSFRFMRELRPDLYMIAVDPWTDESVAASHGTGDAVYASFLESMRGTSYTSVVGTLANMSPYHSDFIFLDGDHNYPGVCADIIAARKILRPGGILAGHDYAGENGVVQAVNEIRLPVNVSDWDGPLLPGAPPGKGRCWWVQL
jgi:predicted O-methyltransferase YrrM